MTIKESNPRAYNPPILFWIAHYANGQSLPQYDPLDGHENRFSDIDQSKLVRFGWYPFTPELKKVVKDEIVVNPLLHHYEMSLQPGQRLISFTEQKLHYGHVHVCLECGFQWQFRNGPGELPIPWSPKQVEMVDKNGRRFISASCPRCGAYTVHVCPKCGIERTKFADGLRCLECQTSLPDKTQIAYFENRKTVYVLGYQETRSGRNRKFLIRIDENGNIEAE